MLIDGTGVGEVGDEVLRDRRHLAEDGVIVPVLAINKQTGRHRGRARTSSRAASSSTTAPTTLLREGAGVHRPTCSTHASVEERTDPGLIKEKIRIELRRFFRKRTGRRPLVLPVVMEI